MAYQSDNFKQIKPIINGEKHDMIKMVAVSDDGATLTTVFTRPGTPPLATEELKGESNLTIKVTNSTDMNFDGIYELNSEHNLLTHDIYYRFYESGDTAPAFTGPVSTALGGFDTIVKSSLLFGTDYVVDTYGIPKKGTEIGVAGKIQPYTFTTSLATGHTPTLTFVEKMGNYITFNFTNTDSDWQNVVNYELGTTTDSTPDFQTSPIDVSGTSSNITVNNLLFNTQYRISYNGQATVVNNTGRIYGLPNSTVYTGSTDTTYKTPYPTGDITVSLNPNYANFTDNTVDYTIINNDSYYAQDVNKGTSIDTDGSDNPEKSTNFTLDASGNNDGTITGLKFGEYANISVNARPINPDHSTDYGQYQTFDSVSTQFVTPSGQTPTFSGIVEADTSVNAQIDNPNAGYAISNLRYAFATNTTLPSTWSTQEVAKGSNLTPSSYEELLFGTTYYLHAGLAPEDPNNPNNYGNYAYNYQSLTTTTPTGAISINGVKDASLIDNIINFTISSDQVTYVQEVTYGTAIDADGLNLPNPTKSSTLSPNLIVGGSDIVSVNGLKFGEYAVISADGKPINPNHPTDLGNPDTINSYAVQFAIPTGQTPTFTGTTVGDTTIDFDINNPNLGYAVSNAKYITSTTSLIPTINDLTLEEIINKNSKYNVSQITGLDFNQIYYIYAALAPEDPNNLLHYGNYGTIASGEVTTNNPQGNITISASSVYYPGSDIGSEDNLIRFTISDNAPYSYSQSVDYGASKRDGNDMVNNEIITNSGSFTIDVANEIAFGETVYLNAQAAPINPYTGAVAANNPNYKTVDTSAVFEVPTGKNPSFTGSVAGDSLSAANIKYDFDINNPNEGYRISNAKYIIGDQIISPTINDLTQSIEIGINSKYNIPTIISSVENPIDFDETRYIYAALAPEDPNNRDNYGNYGSIIEGSLTTANPQGNISVSHEDIYVNGTDLESEDNVVRFTISDAAAYTYSQSVDYGASLSDSNSMLTNETLANGGSFTIDVTGLTFDDIAYLDAQAAPIHPHTGVIGGNPNYETIDTSAIFNKPSGQTPGVTSSVTDNEIQFNIVNPNSGYRISYAKYISKTINSAPVDHTELTNNHGIIDRNTTELATTLSNLPFGTTRYFWSALAPQDPNARTTYGNYGSLGFGSATTNIPSGDQPTSSSSVTDSTITFKSTYNTGYDVSYLQYTTSINTTPGTYANFGEISKNVETDITTLSSLPFNTTRYF
jgi:hypothetical protein